MERFTIDDDKLSDVLHVVHEYDCAISVVDVLDAIDADWQNAAEHQRWLDTADVQEIADWLISLLQ
jgi:hypothetical protein